MFTAPAQMSYKTSTRYQVSAWFSGPTLASIGVCFIFATLPAISPVFVALAITLHLFAGFLPVQMWDQWRETWSL